VTGNGNIGIDGAGCKRSGDIAKFGNAASCIHSVEIDGTLSNMSCYHDSRPVILPIK